MQTPSNLTKKTSLICLVFVFFFIFGTKISYFDLSIFIPAFVLLIAPKKIWQFEKTTLSISFFILVLAAYQSLIQITLNNFDFDSLLRLVRAILVCLIASIAIGSRIFTPDQLLSSIFYSLLFHAIIINASALSEPISTFVSLLSENTRNRPLRSSGLFSGFDIAGLFCIFGSLLLSLEIFKTKNKIQVLIYQIVFAAGSFFTSRVSMAIFLLLFIFIYSKELLQSNLKKSSKYSLTLMLLVVTTFVSYKYVAPIVDVTFSLGIIDVSDEVFTDIVSRHAVQSEDDFLWINMFFLPDSQLGIIFGQGIDAIDSDVGYIKDIFRYGVIGVCFSIFLYINIFTKSLKISNHQNDKDFSFFLKFLLGAIFILSLKNNYFYTRGILPFTILVICLPIFLDIRDRHRRIAALN